MMYGELAKQNASYQTGHNTGWQYAETESGLEWF